ncbi:MAG TPA: glycosyltransferase family 4 protein, partial [Acidobacteriota bacterium]|nr:glycosyltransferase family 4 protein [Acidobacteriota bacterium]
RTDESSVSIDRVFLNGINVYLQQKYPFFRRTNRLLDALIDRTFLLRLVSRFASATDPKDLGALTVSILKGQDGNQKRELAKLVEWIRQEVRPEIIQLTNTMFAGMAGLLKQETKAPVLAALQGEDLFLSGLIEPYRSRALDVLRERLKDVDGFIAPSAYYAGFMSEFLEIPRNKIHVVRLGLNLQGYGQSLSKRYDGSPTIGYLARICPEKGLHVLIKAFRLLSRMPRSSDVKLKVAGYLGKRDRPYFKRLLKNLAQAGLEDRFEYLGEVDREGKMEFFNSIDVFSVPTTYHEPKGIYVLEAMASGVPVVQPRHGAFPELVESTGGGILVEPGSAESLASSIDALLQDYSQRKTLGRRGAAAVQRAYSDEGMAEASLAVYRQYLQPS